MDKHDERDARLTICILMTITIINVFRKPIQTIYYIPSVSVYLKKYKIYGQSPFIIPYMKAINLIK